MATLNVLTLILYPNFFTLLRLPSTSSVPSQVFSTPWYTISKTIDELSILFATVLGNDVSLPEDAKLEQGWRCFQIDAMMDFNLVGVLTTVINPLRDALVPVFVVSTFNTDYVLVKHERIEDAKLALVQVGHTVVEKELN